MPLRFVFSGLAPIALLLALVVSATRAREDAKASSPEKPSSDQEVMLEVQFISMNEANCQKLGLCCTASSESECKTCRDSKKECGKRCGAKNGVKFLTKGEVHKLLETVQGDQTANVFATPNLIVDNGQKGKVEMGEKKDFVTGVTIRTTDGGTVFTPEVESHWLGSKVSLRPVVSADGRYVKTSVNATINTLESEDVPLLPISMPVTFKQETNGEPRHEMVTQFIQQPKFRTVKIDKELVLPDGSTAVFQAWKWTQEVKHVTPILSDIPYLNRLFTNVGMETKCVVMLVKAGIVNQDKPETQTESPLKK